MINKYELIKNFNDKETKFQFSKVIDRFNLSNKNYNSSFTDFLPIYNATLFLNHLNKYTHGTKIEVFGGFEDSERVIIGFYPEFLELDKKDFPISIVNITYNKKYSSSLSHRDFLGAILGIGIKREKVGDIILNEDGNFCFLYDDITKYVVTNLRKVANVHVNASKVNPKNYNFNQVKLKEKLLILCSLRLDIILSSVFNISRSKSLNFIKSEKVFVNWCVQTNPAKLLSVGDNVTLRGIGKLKINEVCGKTKKDKLILNILSSK